MYCDTLHCIVLCCVVFVLCLQRPGEVDTSTFVRQSFVPAGHSFTSDHLASPKLKNTLGSQSDTWHCVVLCCVVLCLCLCLCCVVLDWIGLDRGGSDPIGSDRIRLDWVGLDWIGLD